MKHRHRNAARRRLRVVGLLLSLGLVATACSGDDADRDAAATPTFGDEEPTAAPDGPAGTEGPGGADISDGSDQPDGPASEEEPSPIFEPEGERTVPEEVPPEEVRVVRVGYAFPDLAAFAVLNEDFGIGDPQLQAEAVVDGWRRQGLLPPGIEVDLVFASYNIISTTDKIAACTELAEDADVDIAVSGLTFWVGAECLAERFGIPVIATEGEDRATYQRGAPWLFTLRPDDITYYSAFADWAIDQGILADRRVGLFFETPLTDGVDAMRGRLEAAGVQIVSVTETSGEGIGGPEDRTVVQRFLDDEVDVVLPLVGGSSAVNMYNFAESQGYRPVYLDVDYAEHTTDVAAKTNPANQYDGTLAMTVTRIGEQAGGVENAGAEACLANYERYAAQDISRQPPESGEYSSILRTCDLFTVLLAALTGAADDPSGANFVAALEQAGRIELVGSAGGSFSAEDHSLIDEYRTIQWDAACPCWRAQDDFAAMAPAN
ncbi:ABC transporter substrate-binding protein [Candidatus Poriferisocius sp.]|uniref:ABC transporter substrate-binding protein n=1 Tax=Candidatus Poriferisocius sp. TaxID=3101276 RepID=UPI003B58B9CA